MYESIGPIRIPVYARGNRVVAYALVDREDIEQSRYRWHLHSKGYACRRIGGSRGPMLRLHREVLGLKPGDPREGDHVNRDRLDCRRANLRILPKGGNAQNRSGRGESSYRGVSRHSATGRWQARVRIEGRQHYLGLHDTEEEAAEAARSFRLTHMAYAVD